MAKIAIGSDIARILSTSRLQADISAARLAQQARVRAHNIHYHLTRLRATGVIKRSALINQFALGLENFDIYFSIVPRKGHSTTPFYESLKKHPSVVWAALVSGEYQYSVSLIAQSTKSVIDFLDEISERGKVTIMRKAFVAVHSFSLLGKDYLWPEAKHLPRELEITYPVTSITLDKTDRVILQAMNRCESHLEIARRTSLPRTTIDLRIKKLEKNGCIAGYVNYISALKLNRLTYRLLLHSRGVSKDFYKKAHAFSIAHPCVVSFAKTLGPWDAEIVAEVESAISLTDIIEALNNELSHELLDIGVLQILQQHASIDFKFPEEK